MELRVISYSLTKLGSLNLNKTFQKVLRKIQSLFDIILLGIPWSFTIFLVNAFEMGSADIGEDIAMKYVPLDNRSTSTKMLDLPTNGGREETKSIVKSFQIRVGATSR